VFRDSAGTFGILAYNWTANSATFQGSFDPNAYGFTGNYVINQLVQGGVNLNLGTFSGTLDIRMGVPGGSGNVLNLPIVPGRSLVVLEVVPL